jgi:hypothetical protein
MADFILYEAAACQSYRLMGCMLGRGSSTVNAFHLYGVASKKTVVLSMVFISELHAHTAATSNL